MKIAGTELAFSTYHSLVEKHTRHESLIAGVTPKGVWEPSQLAEGIVASRVREQTDTFEEGNSLLDQYLAGRPLALVAAQEQGKAANHPPKAPSGPSSADPGAMIGKVVSTSASGLPEDSLSLDPAIDSQDRAKIQLLIAILERLTGKKFKFLEPDDLELNATQIDNPGQGQSQVQGIQEAPPAAPVWGLRYNYREIHFEAETTTFAAAGIARTQDGQEIAIQVDLTMSRQFAHEQHMEVRLGGALQDPLVINFEGLAAELSQTWFQFDLDSDGAEEQLRFVGPRSGFLAVDGNENGTVDNGSELFGPTSGDGFAELAAHDEDQNEWIDEGDPIYARLRIWTRDEGGNYQLMGLGQRGIGAIYLGHLTTPFAVKDENNQLQAQIRASGIYLKEDGTAGTVQQLDLVV